MITDNIVSKINIEFVNIAIIANPLNGLDSLCASIALKELIKSAIPKNRNISVDIYYLDNLPFGSEILKDTSKIKNNLGEKSLEITFPTTNTSKVTYNYEQKAKVFKINLIGFEGKIPLKKDIKFKEVKETFDLIIGMGFKDIKNFEEYHKEIETAKRKEIFNIKNLNSKSLTEGIMDLFYKEKIKPNKTASLAFFTYLSSTSAK